MDNPVVKNDPMVPRVARVRSRRREINHTWSLEIEDEHKLPLPGQFYMLYAMNVGEIPVSVSKIKKNGNFIHTVRGVGSISNAINGLKKGSPIGIRGPFGNNWPVDAGKKKDVIVMAGGLGLAPLRPLVQYFIHKPSACRSLTVLYGARGPEEILFYDDLQRWKKNPDTTVEITVDHATYEWKGKVGVVTKLLNPGGLDSKKTVAYICGPEIMMQFCARRLVEQGVSTKSIYLSMERNMKCAIGHCGHCQFGSDFICKDGPVFPYARIGSSLDIREL